MADLVTITENWSSGTIDAKWGTASDANASQAVVAGQLRQTITSSAVGWNYCWIDTGFFTLTGTRVFARLVQPLQGLPVALGGEVTFQVWGEVDGDNLNISWLSDGSITCNYNNEWAYTHIATIPYVAANHAWWGIRQDATTIYFDVAPATASNPPQESDWTNIGSVLKSAIGWNSDSVSLSLISGLNSAAGTPTGPAIWDGINTATVPAFTDAPEAVFDGGVDGVWLDPTPLTRFHTTSSSGVSPSAYSADAGGDQGSWGRWLDRSGNGRDATVTVTDTTRPVVINPTAATWRYYININEVSASIANAGGSSTEGFYVAFTGQPRNYYGELFSDVNTANTGFKLEHDADGPSFKFSVGNGSARFTATAPTGWTRFANPPSGSPRLFECWWDKAANKIYLSVDGGTPAEATITGSVAAGLSTLKINANLGASYRHTEIYEMVVAKNHTPSADVRASVRAYLLAGLTAPATYQDGAAAVSSASGVSGAAQVVRGASAAVSSTSSVTAVGSVIRRASATISSASSVTAAASIASTAGLVFGANVHDGGFSTAENTVVANLLADRNLHHKVRFDLFYDADQTLVRDLATKLLARGGSTQAVLMPAFHWNPDVWGSDLGTVYTEAYDATYAIVNAQKDLFQDFEILNEVQLHDAIWAETTWNSEQESTASYEAGTYCNRFAAVLRGMADAVHAVGAASSLPLRVIMGFVGRDWGFATFLAAEGVEWDVTGFHIYPYEDQDLLTVDTWYGNGVTLFERMAALGKPVTLNEFNAGEIYEAGYENTEGGTLSELGYASMAKHLAAIYSQTQCELESVTFYELWDEPWLTGAESVFGLMYRGADPYPLGAQKVSMFVATAYAGGHLSTSERAELTTERALLTSGAIDSMMVYQGGAATISSTSSVTAAGEVSASYVDASASISSTTSVTAAGEVDSAYVDASAAISSITSVTAAGEVESAYVDASALILATSELWVNAVVPTTWDASAIIAAISSASAAATAGPLWTPVQDTAGAWTEVSEPAATWTPV